MEREIEPTPEERQNGWSADALTRYVAERKARQAEAAGVSLYSSVKHYPEVADGRYDPFRW